MEQLKEIVDDGANGEIEVQVAPVGVFQGSRADGSAIDENITPESLDRLAAQLNAGEEVLVDVDHRSTRPGADKDSSATGWLSGFFTNVKGLFAKMKLTKKGRELIENREYRHLSPVFSLDENGVPVKLHSAAVTNCPAFAGHVEPILNNAPIQEATDMTKEEIVELVKATIAEMNKPAEQPDEAKEEAQNACKAKNEEPETAEKPAEEGEKQCEKACNEEAEPAKPEEKKETCNEEPVKEEAKQETVEKDKEVIKEEALNSAPIPPSDVSQKEAWRDLHGAEFFDYLKSHRDLTRSGM